MVSALEAYQLLDVAYGSSEADIKKAFLRKAMTVHPDHNPSPDANREFVRLQEARDTLLLQDGQFSLPTPPTQSERYQPAPVKVDDDQAAKIVQETLRKRAARKKHEQRRNQGVKARARKAEREAEERLREAEQRRKGRETRERPAASAPPRQTPPVADREVAAARAEQERLGALKREEQAQQARPPRAPTREQSSASDEPAAPAPANSGALGRCAWKGCEVTRDLAAPIETTLGLRRFCAEHREAYREMNLSRTTARRRPRVRR